jgi:hypothetical protein
MLRINAKSLQGTGDLSLAFTKEIGVELDQLTDLFVDRHLREQFFDVDA